MKIRYFWDSILSVAAQNKKKKRKRTHFKVLSFTTLSCTPRAACQPTIFCCFIGSNAVLLGAIPDSLSRGLSSGCTISVKQEQFCAFFTDEFEGLQIIVATWNRRKHVHRKIKLTPDDIDMCAHWAHTTQIDLIQTAAGQWYVNENRNGKNLPQ